MNVFVCQLHITRLDDDTLLDKLRDLNIKPRDIVRGDSYRVYKAEITEEELTILMLTVPGLQWAEHNDT